MLIVSLLLLAGAGGCGPPGGDGTGTDTDTDTSTSIPCTGSYIDITVPTWQSRITTTSGTLTVGGPVEASIANTVVWTNASTTLSGVAVVTRELYLGPRHPFDDCYICYYYGWEAQIPLAIGENTITVDGSDRDGSWRSRDCATITRLPQAPSLTATAGAERVKLRWAPVPEATSYDIYWSTSSGLTTTTGAKIEGAVSPYVHTGLTNNQTYYYLATATSGSYVSPESPVVLAVPAPDFVAPTVQSTAPVPGAAGVPVDAVISVTFNEEINPLTVDPASFLVRGPAGTVAGAVVVSEATATFAPADFLSYRTTYTVTVTSAVKDTSGNAMMSEHSWSFTTGVTPDSIPPSTPSGLSASVVVAGRVDLSWNPSTDNAVVEGYRLYRDGVYRANVSEMSGRDFGLMNTLYCYTVSAVDGAGNESARSDSVCVITADLIPGTVAGWGASAFGQTGVAGNSLCSPVQVPNLSGITAIAGGGSHSLALASDGAVWAWGQALVEGEPMMNLAMPRQVPHPGTVIALAAGGSHSLVLLSDGTVWAWGANAYGQLGVGTTDPSHVLLQLQNIGNVIAISAGEAHSLALRSDGTVWAWGWNRSGQLGDGTTSDSTVPHQVSSLGTVSAISAGGRHSLALKDDGTVWAWGFNSYGQLGDGTTTDGVIPHQVSGLSAVTAIAGGGYHSIALTATGTVWGWGYNGGNLGDGSTTNRSAPVMALDITGVRAVSAGYAFTLAVKSDGSVWSWGVNSSGRLGDCSVEFNRLVPGPVPGLSSITAIDAGSSHGLVLR